MKVIFLDFDGVLIPINATVKLDDYPKPSEEAVRNLNLVVQVTGAMIVVTSAWRNGRSVGELDKLLSSWGTRVTVLDKTRSIEDDRGNEINSWLISHDVGEYVVVDDDPTDLDIFARRRVMPKPEVGISWPDTVEMVRIISGAATYR